VYVDANWYERKGFSAVLSGSRIQKGKTRTTGGVGAPFLAITAPNVAL
jgi:hypothetical protein